MLRVEITKTSVCEGTKLLSQYFDVIIRCSDEATSTIQLSPACSAGRKQLLPSSTISPLKFLLKNLNIYFNKYDSTAYIQGREYGSPIVEEWNYTTWEICEYCEGVREIKRVLSKILFPAFTKCIECSLKSH